MKKWILAAVAAAVLAGGSWIAWHKMRGSVDKTVAQPYQKPNLSVDEIKAKLISKDNKQILEATQQIDKLPAEEKLQALLKLSEVPETPARLRAVKLLRKIDDPRAKERLQKLAMEDPDEDIRDLAASKP